VARRGAHSILSNAAYLIASTGMTRLLRIFYLVVVARYMGPELYGLLSYGQSWYLSFLAITTFGFAIVLPRELGRDRTRSASLIASSLRLQLIAVIVVTFLCLAAGLLIAENPAERNLLLIFSLVLPGRGLAHWAEHIFTGFEKAEYGFRLEAFTRLLEVGSGIAVVIIWQDILLLAMIQVLNWCLQGFLGWRIVLRMCPKAAARPEQGHITKLAKHAFPAAVYTACIMWVMQGPIVLFRQLNGADTALGQVALLLNTFGLLAIIPNMLAYAALPVLSRSVVRADGNDQRFLREFCRVAFVCGTVISLLGSAAGPWIIAWVFGPDYALAGSLLGFTMVLLIPLTIARVAAGVLWARRISAYTVSSALLAGVAMTLTLPVAVAALGPAGAILAAGCGISVWALLALGYFAWMGEIYLLDTILKPVSASVMAIFAYESLVVFSVPAAFACALFLFFVASVLLGTVTIAELKELVALVQKKRGGPE
jgi:O-antigen/teichoic acid export membrane protein